MVCVSVCVLSVLGGGVCPNPANLLDWADCTNVVKAEFSFVMLARARK